MNNRRSLRSLFAVLNMRRLAAAALSLCFLVGTQPAMAAGDDVTRTVQVRTNVGARLNLNLSSTKQNFRVGSNLLSGGSSAVIQLAGNTRTIQAGDRVTAAEFVALQQLLGGGTQSLLLDN